ncbi:hypothetical protein EKO27_g4429 [Xylaria grammica]|uniref:Uncharacterized protein n=1 Tax=Xylaria grammica TaxID=363999 RepID=A0A439D8E7_9PEZI|nr:hypothetical protein EKO27_g4429 [Xylaria grammica]
MNAIISKDPALFYMVDARFQSKRWERRALAQREKRRGHLMTEQEQEQEQGGAPFPPSLVHVIRTQHIHYVEWVLRLFQIVFGCNRINHKCAIGYATPVDAAITSGRLDVLDLLIEHDCDLTVNLKSLPQRAQIARLERRFKEAWADSHPREGYKLFRPYVLALLCGHDGAAIKLFYCCSGRTSPRVYLYMYVFRYYAWWVAVQLRSEEVAVELLSHVIDSPGDMPHFQNDALNWAVSINNSQLVHGILAGSVVSPIGDEDLTCSPITPRLKYNTIRTAAQKGHWDIATTLVRLKGLYFMRGVSRQTVLSALKLSAATDDAFAFTKLILTWYTYGVENESDKEFSLEELFVHDNIEQPHNDDPDDPEPHEYGSDDDDSSDTDNTDDTDDTSHSPSVSDDDDSGHADDTSHSLSNSDDGSFYAPHLASPQLRRLYLRDDSDGDTYASSTDTDDLDDIDGEVDDSVEDGGEDEADDNDGSEDIEPLSPVLLPLLLSAPRRGGPTNETWDCILDANGDGPSHDFEEIVLREAAKHNALITMCFVLRRCGEREGLFPRASRGAE